MTGKSILACAGPVGAHWQLGILPPVAGTATLIGWRLPADTIDSGVPLEAAACLARAMTSVATVSFPVSEVDNPTLEAWRKRGNQVRSLGGASLIERAKAAFRHEPRIVTLVSTRDPGIALRLFEDAGFPWRLQGQVALLSGPNAEAPVLDRETLLSLIDGWEANPERLACGGILGVMRPGVDGDIAGVLTLADETTQALLQAFEHEARCAGFDWLLLSENDFMDMLGAPRSF